MYFHNKIKFIQEYQKPSTKILWGIFFLVVGFLLFYVLNDIEKNGGSLRLNLILFIIYEKFGKNIVSVIFIIIGSGKIVSGIIDYQNIKRLEINNILKKANNNFTLKSGEKYEFVRSISRENKELFPNLILPVIENQLFMHFWTEELIFEDQNVINWLNLKKYFWKESVLFGDKSLPETFNNYQHRNFIFTDIAKNNEIMNETVFLDEDNSEISYKHFYKNQDKIYLLQELQELHYMQYVQIQDYEWDSIEEILENYNSYFILIVKTNIKYFNTTFYIDNESISIEHAYSIGGIEIIRIN